MPELPEVEVLVRHLAPLVKDRVIRRIEVRRPRVLRPISANRFQGTLRGARFEGLSRRGKYLLFTLRSRRGNGPLTLVGHLGMTGRFYVARRGQPQPKHAAVVFDLGPVHLVYEDPRYFGRLLLAAAPPPQLGPEPLGPHFTVAYFRQALKRSAQPIKVRLLEQSLVAGVGNIYASEALFRARLSPRLAARRLQPGQVRRLWRALRAVLAEAIAWGSTVPLNFSSAGERDGLFYFGRASGAPGSYTERLRVYDREGQPCRRCRTPIRRMVQGARSTYFCPRCQMGKTG